MKKPQAIVIIGNIASGKTTLAKLLCQHLPDFAYVCLDDIRVQLTDANPDINAVARDRKAETEAMRRMDINRFVVFESTGASLFYHRAMLRMRDKFEILTVKLEADERELFWRYLDRKERGQFQLPPAHASTSPIRELIQRQQSVIRGLPADITLDSCELKPKDILAKTLTAYAAKLQKVSP